MRRILINLIAIIAILVMIGCDDNGIHESRGDLYSGNQNGVAFSMADVEEEAFNDHSFELIKQAPSYSINTIVPKSEEPPTSITNSNSASDLSKPMIIKNGNMTIEVDDLSAGKSKLDSILTKYNGHYQSENYNKGHNQSSYSLVLRIPVYEWDKMLTGMSDGIGSVKDKSVNAQDVTEEYTDLQLRLENNTAYLKRYLKLLDKADSIKDMLIIQEKVRNIEEEIESKKGRMKFLKSKVSYSTLHLTLVEHHPVLASADDQHFGHQIASAFISGYNGLLGFVLILTGMWPFLLIVGCVVWFVKKVWKRRFGVRKKVVA